MGISPRFNNPYEADPNDPYKSKEFSKDSRPYVFSDKLDPYQSNPQLQNQPKQINPFKSKPTFYDPEDPFNSREDPSFAPEDAVIPRPKNSSEQPRWINTQISDHRTEPYYYDSAFDDGDNKLARDMEVLNPDQKEWEYDDD